MMNETASPISVLQAYSQQRATAHDVHRSIVSYRNWLAPLPIMAQHLDTHRVFDSIVVFDSQFYFPPDELWLFTDREAAQRAIAKGGSLGSYVSGISGTELFLNPNPPWNKVQINIGSLPEMTWYIEADGRGGLRIEKVWADAIAFEENFKRWHHTGKPDLETLKKYEAFLLFNNVNGYVVTLPDRAGLTNAAAVFTAPDCADAFLAKLPEQVRGECSRVASSGAMLLERLSLQNIDGMIFNVLGPAPSFVLPLSET
jgi:hypothetical protein